VEDVVNCLEEDGLGGGERGVDFYKGCGLGGVGDEGLFYQNVFSGAEGPDGPFVVEAVWQWDVDCVYGGVVQEGWMWISVFYGTGQEAGSLNCKYRYFAI
jgi:hypothetical protein